MTTNNGRFVWHEYSITSFGLPVGSPHRLITTVRRKTMSCVDRLFVNRGRGQCLC